MKLHSDLAKSSTKKLSLIVLAAFLLSFVASLAPSGVSSGVGNVSAACLPTPPPATYGQVKQSITVNTAGNYRVWSRIKVPNTTANSYYFQVDSGCTYNVGDSTSIAANTWTWVDYQDGSTSTKIDVELTAGTHQLTYTGKEADVQLDRVMLLTNKSCVPTDVGNNCAVDDNTPPATAVTAPAGGATVNGTVNVAATASDASGIQKVEFYVDDVLQSPVDTTSAYTYAWDTTKVSNGTHTLHTKAYDNSPSPNIGNSAKIRVTVNNPDSSPPTAPAALNSPTQTANSVSLSWTGSTDNVAVVGYRVFRGATQVGTPTGTTYTDSGLTASTAYTYTVKAIDGANNLSAASNAVTVSTKAETTPPTVSITAPANGSASATGSTVNITATASDNVGVTKVEFYVDGTLKTTVNAPAAYAYAWNTTGVAAGVHALTARAYDAANNSTLSSVVSVTLTASTANGPGDVNGDKRVNALDLSALISRDGQNYPAADFNNDGTVGAADMAILLSKWTW